MPAGKITWIDYKISVVGNCLPVREFLTKKILSQLKDSVRFCCQETAVIYNAHHHTVVEVKQNTPSACIELAAIQTTLTTTQGYSTARETTDIAPP
jgi:hypothetical protein